MDYFKVQQETLQYLRDQSKQFNKIINCLKNIASFSPLIFSLFPCSLSLISKQTQQYNDFNSSNFESLKKYNKQDMCLSQDEGTTKKTDEQIQDLGPLYEMFWMGVVQKTQTKQQKYVLLLQVAYAYFNICSKQKINERVSVLDVQFENFINKYSNKNLPYLLRLCYHLRELNVLIINSKDLILIRQLCIKIKQVIVDNIQGQKLKQNQRNQWINSQRGKKKNGKNKEYLKRKSHHFNKVTGSFQFGNNQIDNFGQQDNQRITKKTIQTSKSEYSIHHKDFMLGNLSVKKCLQIFEELPKAQQYSKLFLWKIDSCRILIDQILGKKSYVKQQFMNYLKMGQFIRQKYCVGKQKEQQRMLQKYQFEILQEMIYGYSVIVQNSRRLKQLKYYKMLILQLQICYRKGLKIKNKIMQERQKSLKKSIKSSSASFHNIHHNHSNSGSIKNGGYSQQLKVKQRLDQLGNSNDLQDKNEKIKRSRHIIFDGVSNRKIKEMQDEKHVDDKNVNDSMRQSMRSRVFKSRESAERRSFRKSIDYKSVGQQIDDVKLKQQLQDYDQYFDGNSFEQRQQQYMRIQNNKKKNRVFIKGMNYFTERKTQFDTNFYKNLKYETELEKNFKTQRAKQNVNESTKRSNKINNEYDNYSSYSLNKNVIKSLQKVSRGLSPRKGMIMKNQQFKKQILNIVSITKRSIKPGKYFDEVKDFDNNLYTNIISTEKKIVVVSNQRLLEEIELIDKIVSEKPTPTFDQVMIIGESKNFGNKKGYEGDTVSVNAALYQSIGKIDTQKVVEQTIKLTMIQNLSRRIGYIQISLLKESKEEINFSCEYLGLLKEKLTILDKNESHSKNTNNSTNKSINKCNNSVGHKCILNFDQLRKQLTLSQFYFELIQQNMQKNIKMCDVEYIIEYIKQRNRIQQKQQQIQQQQLNYYKIKALQLICVGRISRSLLYWYYTKGNKINGSVLLKRQIPYIQDPLKFSIALDFMKKYTMRECLYKLSNVRNKRALYECFQYLLYGRKYIVKGLLIRKNAFVFYTLSLEHLSDKNFRIRSIQEGGSQFEDVEFVLTIYNRMTMSIIQINKYEIRNVLDGYSVTMMMLGNIVEECISKRILEIVVKDIEDKESENICVINKYNINKRYQIQQQIISDKQKIYKNWLLVYEQIINKSIINYIYILLRYVQICNIGIDFRVKYQDRRVLCIQGVYVFLVQYYLGCGLVLQVYKDCKNKGRYNQIFICNARDNDEVKRRDDVEIEGLNLQLERYNDLLAFSFDKKAKMSRIGKRKKKNVSKMLYRAQSLRFDNKSSNSIQESSMNNTMNDGKGGSFLYRGDDRSMNDRKGGERYKIYRTAYCSEIVLRSQNKDRLLVNKITKSVLQREVMDTVYIVLKKVMKIGKGYYYVCLSYYRCVNFYRVDIYNHQNSKRYGVMFRESEIAQHLTVKCQKRNSHGNGSGHVIAPIRNKSGYETSLIGVPKSKFTHYSTKNRLSNISNQRYQNDNISVKGQLNQFDYVNKRNSRFTTSFIFQKQLFKEILTEKYVKNGKDGKDGRNGKDGKNGKNGKDHQKIKQLFLTKRIGFDLIAKKFYIKTQTSLQKCSEIKSKLTTFSLFESYNNLSTFEGKNNGRIQLIDLNSKLYLLIFLENRKNPYICLIDDSPFMNNINLFADYHIKEHLVNLHTDLFMRTYVRFIGNSLCMQEINSMQQLQVL